VCYLKYREYFKFYYHIKEFIWRLSTELAKQNRFQRERPRKQNSLEAASGSEEQLK